MFTVASDLESPSANGLGQTGQSWSDKSLPSLAVRRFRQFRDWIGNIRQRLSVSTTDPVSELIFKLRLDFRGYGRERGPMSDQTLV